MKRCVSLAHGHLPAAAGCLSLPFRGRVPGRSRGMARSRISRGSGLTEDRVCDANVVVRRERRSLWTSTSVAPPAPSWIMWRKPSDGAVLPSRARWHAVSPPGAAQGRPCTVGLESAPKDQGANGCGAMDVHAGTLACRPPFTWPLNLHFSGGARDARPGERPEVESIP